LLGAESIPWEHKREEELKSYDLRPLVLELAVVRSSQPRAAAAPASETAHSRQQTAHPGPDRGAQAPSPAGIVTLRMLLRNDSTAGSGRPEQVARALGLGEPSRIHRTRLVLAERSPARDAIRKHGKFAV
jgi:hypothetical protein